MPAYKSGHLTLHSADMTKPGSYDEVFEGCSTVFHPAEVFMSFGFGRDQKNARDDFTVNTPGKLSTASLGGAARTTAMNIVNSINKSSTVTRLIYTSSIAAMSSGFGSNPPIVDESCEPGGSPNDYGPTKRLTEKLFEYEAYLSGGKWSMATGNPGDIVGPILSPHQASETWQGKIACIIQGIPAPQEPGNRPWTFIDVRDIAEAEIRLAESKSLRSGERYLLASGDNVPPESMAMRAMEMYPEWDCAITMAPPAGAKKISRTIPHWMRLQIRSDKVQKKVGIQFRRFDDTFKATIDSLVSVGGIKPKLKK